MKRRYPWLAVLLVLALTACGAPGASGPEAPPPVESSALPQDNRNTSWEVFPDDTGWYVCVAGTVRYYDFASGQTMTLCAQPGCSHRDESCQAWLGKSTGLGVCDGTIYAALTDDTSGAQLVSKDIATGQIMVLERWDNQAGTFYSAAMGWISRGMAIVYLTRQTLEQQEDGLQSYRKETTTYLYDLSAGTGRVLFTPEEGAGRRLLGFTDRYLAVSYTLPEQSLLNPEEFEQQYGENASYGRYAYFNTHCQLLLYDLSDGTQIIIADHDRDGYIMTADPCTAYGKDCIYQCGDTLYLLDLDTGKSRALVTMEHIINYWLMDNKAFILTDEGMDHETYILDNDASKSALWCADLWDGQAVELENAMNDSGMILSIHQEGGSFFRGLGPLGRCVISKEDFYAGRYDQAVAAG